MKSKLKKTTNKNTLSSRERRGRLRGKGYKEVRNLWVMPENVEKIKNYAKFLEENCGDD